MGTLFLVATPIGNLRDMTDRARTVLAEVGLVAAEDTRRTRTLLSHFGIATPLVSYHAHNERARRDEVLAALASGDVAVVSDAGTPGISDPGNDLVNAAIDAGHAVVPVPGPSALIAAVSASGLVEGPFVALGFLPRKGVERRLRLGRAIATGFPIALFEAPTRLADLLRELALLVGDRPAVVCRELTKLHEEIRRGKLTALADHYRANPARGEVVVVVGGAGDTAVADGDEAREVLSGLLRARLSVGQAAREAAVMTGLPRSELYTLALALRDETQRAMVEKADL